MIFLLDYQRNIQTAWKEITSDEFCKTLKKTPNASFRKYTTTEEEEIKEETDNAISHFKWFSWGCASAGLLLFLFDVLWGLLTTERLIVFGIIIALVLFPYLRQIKFLGIVLKRLK